MSETIKYHCGCIIEFADNGQGKIINICENCKKGYNLSPKWWL
jgi:hypothetical protein